MIEYPSTLPRPSQSYGVSINNNAIRTEMDSGRIRQRRRYVASQNQINVVWQFTDEEFQYFESFAFHALNGATSWFTMDVLTGGGITAHKVRIVKGEYSAKYRGFMGWSVSATLDVEEINRLDQSILFEDMYGIPMYQFGNEITSIMNRYYTRSWHE